MKALDTPLRVFCSFAPEDTDLCSQLHNHLRPLEREGMLTFWHQRLITAGTDWATAIDEQLASASIILLLISPAFFTSDYRYGVEMQLAMQRHEAGDARVIPLIMRSVDWTLAPFAHLSPLPITGKPIAEQRHRDAAFANVVADLRRVMEELMPTSMNRSHQDSVSRVWNVPYPRNLHFTGRDELLGRLDQQFSPTLQSTSPITRRIALTQPQAIKGLGGIGKTQIAVEYAYRARERGRYAHTIWINAANEEAIMTSFVALADLLPSFSAKSETDQRKLVEAIKYWLEQCKQCWLLIFDNADEVSLIQEYLPHRGNGSILLTTRAEAVGSLAISVEVEKMGFVEGTHLLLRRAQRFTEASDEEANEAGNIVVALDHFPLALDQAGAYIEETRCRFIDYLEVYQTHRAALLARRGTQATNYPDSVATTWSLSFQKIEQTNPAASELLRLCAFLAPDRIPEELIRDGATHWPFLLQQATADRLTFNQMLQDLLKFSLVKRLAEDNMLGIHRLVQAVQMDRIEQEEQRHWAERVIRAMSDVFPHDPTKVATWPQCLRYLEQAQACDGLIQQHMLVFVEAANLLSHTGTYLREHASYTIAEPLYLRALSIQEQQLGPEHLDSARCLNNLAELYWRQGKYEQAETLYLRTLHLWEQALGPEHADIGFPLNRLANLYKEQGKYEQAETFYLRALHLREQVLGPEHPDVAHTLNALANLYKHRGKPEQAETLYLRALHLREQVLGPEHLDIAYTLNGLANLFRHQGKYEQAKPLYQRALRIREQVLGPEHPDVAHTLNGLADLYRDQGKYRQAEPLYQRCLLLWKQIPGPEHPNMAYPLNGLAFLYWRQGEYGQAEQFYRHALDLWGQASGRKNPDIVYPLSGLGLLYTNQGRYREAENCYQQALALYQQVIISNHMNIAYILEGYTFLLFKRGRVLGAAQTYGQLLRAVGIKKAIHAIWKGLRIYTRRAFHQKKR